MKYLDWIVGGLLVWGTLGACTVVESHEAEEPEILPSAELPTGCGVETLQGALPLELEFNTTGSGDEFELSCSVGTSSGDEEVALFWVSPASAYYSFEVVDATFDAVLGVLEPTCDGEARRCNDESSRSGVDARVVLLFEQGEAALVVVDGYQAGESGRGRLRVQAAEVLCEDGEDGDGDGKVDCADLDCESAPHCLGIECPGEELVTLPATVEGRLEGGSTLGDASCSNGGNRSGERAFGFVAPVSGTFRFDTGGSSVDTVLYVRDGVCTGPELGCNDDGGTGKASLLELALEQGQRVVVVVDGWSSQGGDFRLQISAAEWDCGDGEDNDGDGAIDCADYDCVSEACASLGEWPMDWTLWEEEMLTEVNLRRAAGATCDQDVFDPAPALVMEPALRRSARLHSLDMATQDYFEHESLDGRSPDERMRAAGFTGAYPTGENISGGYETARSSVEGLMNSPGHCRNIMDPDYGVVGMGHAFNRASSLGQYWTQNFGGSP